MKRLLFAFALCTPLLASAGQLEFSCIGPDAPDCPLAIDATFENERLTVAYVTGPAINLNHPTTTVGYCAISPWNSHVAWTPAGCYETGTYRIINGELTKLQVAKAMVTFEWHQRAGFCMEIFTKVWTTRCWNQNYGGDPNWLIF
ncbi:hypothetical protein HNP48_001752 [Acidovorax soli]|uniref:Uncharacterized protein n=1 Tax=Acidovorax soli TaxID=592050 RepID=A0A7X0PBY1_9BURK|nr:hypothetical protein [Acidovorax soli]MBB6559088.1 hypothetical protein [Acidovorax soli]